ncbi:hypothetical protein L3X38_018406 [Prunus dulcis]|uniref:Uncharacterized protein n=1 Tax=Prunus dulcis TaxID=3755 RepID=A0AAD4W966_PRUDU|nr:hypothetical protein L3X38_018406 [Prunus dulcis]
MAWCQPCRLSLGFDANHYGFLGVVVLKLVYVTEESSVFSKAFFCGTETVSKMNHFNVQHQNASYVGCEDVRGSAFISDTKNPVVCPKPRRVGILSNSPIRPLRWQMSSHQSEFSDSKAGAELLDLILRKEGYGLEQSLNDVASSPPYFCGSPPSRASNPLIQDARFGDEKFTPVSASPSPSTLSSPRKAGCVRMKYGLKPAAVRVEGFDCLNRDRQNSSIPAFA